MDWVFGIVLHIAMVHLLVISYDIICQWFINLFKRMEEHWLDEIKPTQPIKLIPHLYMLPSSIIYWVLPNNKIYPQQKLPTTQILVTCSVAAGGGWG